MATAPAIFFDIGGVLLSNAWDTPTRDRAIETFRLDQQDFQTRHGMLKTAFETGRMTLDAYLQKTVFSKPRDFTPEVFRDFMFAQSKVLGETLEWVRHLAATGRFLLFTLNNESRELHEYRAGTFKLGKIFRAFFTSCYLGQVKPNEDIYLNALGISGRGRHEAIFIDDRPLNVEAALALGLHAIHYTGLDELRAELAEFGVTA